MKLIQGNREVLENKLVAEIFRPTAEESPVAESLLSVLAPRGKLRLIENFHRNIWMSQRKDSRK